MSNTAAIRALNQSRLLQLLQRQGPMTRAGIARELQLMRSTAGNLVAALERDGMVCENGSSQNDHQQPSPSREVGRPGRLVQIKSNHSWFLGADIGVGYVRLVAIDLAGQVAATRMRAVPQRDQTPEHTVEVLSLLTRDILEAAPRAAVRGLCVAAPGMVDRNGIINRAPILGWRNVPFQHIVRQHLPEIPNVRCENDANAFAFSELLGHNKPVPNDALFMWIDSGVGGAIWTEKKIQRGHAGYAGEFGHIFIGSSETDDPRSGSLEHFVGRSAIIDHHRRLGGTQENLEDLLSSLDSGDSKARRTMDLWSRSLARGLATLTSCFNPEIVVFGGPVSEILRRCLDRTRASLQEYMVDSSLVPDLRISGVGADGAAIGCGLLLNHSYIGIDEIEMLSKS